MNSKNEVSTTDQEKLEGLGGYTIAVIFIAASCIGACFYLFRDHDPIAPWFGALLGVCGLGMALYGWALASMWWFRRTGAHGWWAIKPR